MRGEIRAAYRHPATERQQFQVVAQVHVGQHLDDHVNTVAFSRILKTPRRWRVVILHLHTLNIYSRSGTNLDFIHVVLFSVVKGHVCSVTEHELHAVRGSCCTQNLQSERSGQLTRRNSDLTSNTHSLVNTLLKSSTSTQATYTHITYSSRLLTNNKTMRCNTPQLMFGHMEGCFYIYLFI